jgi:hypothetical protein
MVEPQGSGIISPESGVFGYGETVTFQATPAEGYVFTSWSGDIKGRSAAISVTVFVNMRICANFTRVEERPAAKAVAPSVKAAPVLVCSSDQDRAAGKLIADKYNFSFAHPLDRVASSAPEGDWVLVDTAGRDSKFQQVFGQPVSPRDCRHICIFHKSNLYVDNAERTVWGITGWDKLDTLMSAQWVAEKGLPRKDERAPWVVIQCCPPPVEKNPLCDDNLSKLLRQKFGFEVVHYRPAGQNATPDNAKLQQYQGWVLIGTPDSNPLLEIIFRGLKVETHHIALSYKRETYGGKDKHIWAITGKSRIEVHATAMWVLANGLPAYSVHKKTIEALKGQ